MKPTPMPAYRSPTRVERIALIAAMVFAIGYMVIMFAVPPAEAHVTLGQLQVADGQDAVWSFTFDAAANANTMDVTLTEIKDTNNDGDFQEAEETDNFINQQPVTNAADCQDVDISPHMSCMSDTTAGANQQYIFRNESTRHKPGNYSLTIRFLDNLGGLLSRASGGLRITADQVLASDLDAAKDEILDSVDDHAQESVIDDAQDYVVSINQADANSGVTQIRYHLLRITDNNGDGDFADASEQTTILNEMTSITTCASGTLALHLSCLVSFTDENARIVWRNGSASHIPGNYSFTVTWLDAMAADIWVNTYGIRIQPRLAEEGSLRNAETNLTSVHNTHETNSITRDNTHNTNTSGFVERHDVNQTEQHIAHNRNATEEVMISYWDNQNATLAFRGIASQTPTSWSLNVFQYRDLNGDGDFEDADERSAIISNNNDALNDCASLEANGLSCRIVFSDQSAFFVWRDNATNHEVGDYGWEFSWQTAGNVKIQNYTIGVKITDPPVGGTITNTDIITNPPNMLNDLISRAAIIVGIFLLLAWASFQSGYSLPFGACILSLVSLLVLVNNLEMLGDESFTSYAASTFIVPMAFGGWNIGATWRNRSRTSQDGSAEPTEG